jgi:ribosomal protein L37AE/L43A
MSSKCKHCETELIKSVRKINGETVCNECFDEFKKAQYAIYFEDAKFAKKEQWWNWENFKRRKA